VVEIGEVRRVLRGLGRQGDAASAMLTDALGGNVSGRTHADKVRICRAVTAVEDALELERGSAWVPVRRALQDLRRSMEIHLD
jgi:hypothetical protein